MVVYSAAFFIFWLAVIVSRRVRSFGRKGRKWRSGLIHFILFHAQKGHAGGMSLRALLKRFLRLISFLYTLPFAHCLLLIAHCLLTFVPACLRKDTASFWSLLLTDSQGANCLLPTDFIGSSVHLFICSASSLLRGFLVVCSQNGGVLRGRYDQFTKELRGRPCRGLIINAVCYIILSRMFRFMSRKVKQLPV